MGTDADIKVSVEERPWGSYELFVTNANCTVKLLHVRAEERLSYQYHKNRSEFWRVVSGRVLITLDGKEMILNTGDSVSIPVGVKHRLRGIENSSILEIAFGKFDENDIVRLEDDYNRI